MTDPRFVPPHPPRNPSAAPVWSGLFGERARNSVHGWSEAAFTTTHIRRKVFRFTVHIPLAPASIRHVMLDNVANYAKPDIVKRLLAPMIGRGLLSSDGELWRSQRRIVAASFRPPAIDALVPAFAAAAEARMAAWRAGDRRDMAAEATGTTMAIIADTLFGGDKRLKTSEARRNIEAALEAGGETRLPAILGLPMLGWTLKIRAGQRGQEFLRRALADLVRDRARDGGDDFLGGLIASLDERFDTAEARMLAVDNATTFYLAGHETTANAITWTLYLLSEQPELQSGLAEEAKAALAAGDDDPGLADRLPRLRFVLDEALRLYPPVPRFDRQALGPDRIGDTDVEAGDIVSIWPWLLHRHKALWDDPDAFDSARFEASRSEGRDRFQYIPFGDGPRVCVGARFAIIEALVILAHWLAQWRFSPEPGRAVRPVGTVTLRPEGGLPLQLSARD